MLDRIKKLIRLFLGEKKSDPNVGLTFKFPYKYRDSFSGLIFNINNPIEEFRLKSWGGEKEYVESILEELNKEDVFYDIGSSVGLISIHAAKKVENGTVISFEPDPENLASLNENYKVNNLKNCVIQSIAVGAAKSKMKLYTAGSNAYSPSLQQVNGIDTFIEVEVDSIDHLLERQAIPFPTVIKIDIEGAEMMALKGMKNLLSSEERPRVLFIELHPEFLPSFNTTAEEIFDFLAELKYDLMENTKRDQQILCKLVRSN